MAYYLGIDGGGTKTRCLLGDETTVLATATSGGSNIVRLGEARAREGLHAVVRQVCVAAKISPDRIDAICIGAAGAARPEISAKIRGILSELLSEPAAGMSEPRIRETNIEVVGDAAIALDAAFGNGPGVIAIAGTGSIVYGRDATGNIARAGGWGFAISDEGSGHWIGCRTVSSILSAQDQGIETQLTAVVLQAWKLTTIGELVQRANSTPPPDFPRLFPIVLRAAAEGDSIACDLLDDAGKRLAALAAMVIRRLVRDSPEFVPPIAMTGSVFRQSQAVREVFYNVLERSFPGIEVHQELVEPVEGALARARASAERID